MSTAAPPLAQRELFRFCACCPSPCRGAIAPDDVVQDESVTPSSLALIALAVMEGQLPLDAAVRTALARTGPAYRCASACPHGHRVAEAVDAFVAASP